MRGLIGRDCTDVITRETPEYRVFSALPCFRCGICCHHYQPRVDLVEAKTVADNLGITWHEFAANYLDSRYFGEERFLLGQQNGTCVFLEQLNERVAICRIHPFKPSACRDWMPSLFRKECQTGLAQLWKLNVDQEGNLLGNTDDLLRFYSFVSSLSQC